MNLRADGIFPTGLTDGYKLDHRRQYINGTTDVVANMTPRKSRIPGVEGVVVFGVQYYALSTLIEIWNRDFFQRDINEITDDYVQELVEYTLSPEAVKEMGTEHWTALHKLGYMPLEIRALEEGTICPIKVPCYTVRETHPDFFWLVNYIETDMSAETWPLMTTATIAHEYKKIFHKWAKKTGGDLNFIDLQGHNFSYRGNFGREAALLADMGHLTSFRGSDTFPGRKRMKQYYKAKQDGFKDIISCSVSATEHAVMCSSIGFFIKKDGLTWEKYGEAEFQVFKRLITELYPSGFVSIVSDTFNLWKVLMDFIPRLKDEIMARDGKVIIRPDSGDPADILCGLNIKEYNTLEEAKEDFKEDLYDNTVHGEREFTIDTTRIIKVNNQYYELSESTEWNRYDKQYYFIEDMEINSKEIDSKPSYKGVVELLWDTFKGTFVTGEDSKQYKVLDSHIGCIYGDSITLERAENICSRLAEKGFVSTNWVAGIGSYTYQYVTRDTFGFAQKATFTKFILDGEEIGCEIFKDPITDDGTKKSARGLVMVLKDENGKYYLRDQVSEEEFNSDENELKVVFRNSEIIRDFSLEKIRESLNSKL